MTSGYTRQSSAVIVNGLIINDSDFNNEFNQLVLAFDKTSGHTHDGSSTGQGPQISLTTSVSGILPGINGGITSSASDPTTANGTPTYAVGSIWVNTTSKDVFQCTDNTNAAAVWTRRNGISNASAPTTTSDKAHNYIIGSVWIDTSVSPSLTWICLDNTNAAAVWYPVGRGRIGVITGASTIPTTAEDSTKGYSQGSIILNTTQGVAYLCTSAAASAATWIPFGKGATFASAGNPGATDDNTKGYAVGSIGVNTSTTQCFIAQTVGTGTATWVAVSGTKPGLATNVAQVAGFVAVAGNLYPVDCTSSAITVTLPASAALNDMIGFVIFGSNGIVLNPNSLNINGSTGNLTILDEETLFITYSGATRGWV